MKSDGMHFGSHGCSHEWFGYLSFKDKTAGGGDFLKFYHLLMGEY